jgi:starch phosphorylase
MNDRSIAYFSMEIALDPAMPTYSGGLGILAGDTVHSAADLKVPMLAVTLLHRKGYLVQRLDGSGWQQEEPAVWNVANFAQEMPPRIRVFIEGRAIQVRAWKYLMKGLGDFDVPVFLLDTDLPENSPWDRTLTDYLYGGDQFYRLCQEVILGIGGVRMLRALGFAHLERFHMNEGHASLLTVELLREQAQQGGRPQASHEDIEAVRQKCIFTTHTPVPAGHDQFSMDLVARIIGPRADFVDMRDLFCLDLVKHVFGDRQTFASMEEVLGSDAKLNLTYLALNLSHYVNGVAKKHGEVSRLMFAGYEIDAITNGVHAETWTSPPFRELYDRFLPGWQQDNFSLRYAHSIPLAELWAAHLLAKKRLLEHLNRATNAGFDENTFTLGFARRATPYKRPNLLLHDVARLKAIASKAGGLQVVYGGKAHPNDQGGKELIQRILQLKGSLVPEIKLVYLENYDMEQAKLLTSGVELWLNTPQPPLEASGTSGMKAALNGVPSFSILDGWWIEGWVEGETGWAIGENCAKSPTDPERSSCDAASLYHKLETIILPMFYHDRNRFIDVMRHCISLNASFFNTQRMVQQYVLKGYFQ